MDKSWISKPRNDKAYMDGVTNFIKFAVEKAIINGKILCPCRKCYNRFSFSSEVVEEHLIWNGFLLGYTDWVLHGESFLMSRFDDSSIEETLTDQRTSSMQGGKLGQDDIGGLLRDAFGITTNDMNTTVIENETIIENLDEPNDEAHASREFDGQHFSECPTNASTNDTNQYEKLVLDCDQELYPGCKNYSKISFILRLFHLKSLNGWSGKSFTMLLQLLKDAFPKGTSLPISSYEAKKLIKELGLGYEKIHACPNDCILYSGERLNQENCEVCGDE